jgi:hypothetical protein
VFVFGDHAGEEEAGGAEARGCRIAERQIEVDRIDLAAAKIDEVAADLLRGVLPAVPHRDSRHAKFRAHPDIEPRRLGEIRRRVASSAMNTFIVLNSACRR